MNKYILPIIFVSFILTGCQERSNENIADGIIYTPAVISQMLYITETIEFNNTSGIIDKETIELVQSSNMTHFQYWLFGNADPNEGYIPDPRYAWLYGWYGIDGNGIYTIRSMIIRSMYFSHRLRPPVKSLRLYINNRIVISRSSFTDGDWLNETFSGSYEITEEYGITYLMVHWDDNTSERFLVLYSYSHIVLYNSNAEPFFLGDNSYYSSLWLRSAYTDILSATSELRENDILHSTDNLDLRIGIGWSNGFLVHGIGEKIVFSRERLGYRSAFNFLFISTGFVCFYRPYLFSHYSRPRQLRISYEGESPRIRELADTPNLQIIEIWWPSQSQMGKDLWIEILEVYPGASFENTFINAFAWGFGQ